MVKAYFKSISHGCAAFLCTLSMWTMPTPAIADCCNVPCEEDCCESGGLFGKSALLLGGAAVVGGIAGAIAGNASSGHGRRGRTGPVGPAGAGLPPGTTGITSDLTGNTLTFTPTLTLTLAVLAPGAAVTPFVIRPDGSAIEGPTVGLALGLLGPLTLAPIVDPTPQYGTYHVGVRLAPAGLLVSLGIGVQTLVLASRNGSITSLGIAAPALTVPLLGGANEEQVTQEFSYDNLTIP